MAARVPFANTMAPLREWVGGCDVCEQEGRDGERERESKVLAFIVSDYMGAVSEAPVTAATGRALFFSQKIEIWSFPI